MYIVLNAPAATGETRGFGAFCVEMMSRELMFTDNVLINSNYQ